MRDCVELKIPETVLGLVRYVTFYFPLVQTPKGNIRKWRFWENRFEGFHFYTIPHTQFFKIPLVELIRALFVKKSIFRLFQWKSMSNENHAVENFFSCGLFYIDIRAITFAFGENSLSRKVFQKLSLNFLFWKQEKNWNFRAAWWAFPQLKWKFVL